MKFITDSEEYEFSISRTVVDDDLLFSLEMNKNRTFFERLKFYLKYLFGYRCRYGDFDCLSLSKKDAERIMLRLRNEQ
jgi:hypothetical protein